MCSKNSQKLPLSNSGGSHAKISKYYCFSLSFTPFITWNFYQTKNSDNEYQLLQSWQNGKQKNSTRIRKTIVSSLTSNRLTFNYKPTHNPRKTQVVKIILFITCLTHYFLHLARLEQTQYGPRVSTETSQWWGLIFQI